MYIIEKVWKKVEWYNVNMKKYMKAYLSEKISLEWKYISLMKVKEKYENEERENENK